MHGDFNHYVTTLQIFAPPFVVHENEGSQLTQWSKVLSRSSSSRLWHCIGNTFRKKIKMVSESPWKPKTQEWICTGGNVFSVNYNKKACAQMCMNEQSIYFVLMAPVALDTIFSMLNS